MEPSPWEPRERPMGASLGVSGVLTLPSLFVDLHLSLSYSLVV